MWHSRRIPLISKEKFELESVQCLLQIDLRLKRDQKSTVCFEDFMGSECNFNWIFRFRCENVGVPWNFERNFSNEQRKIGYFVHEKLCEKKEILQINWPLHPLNFYYAPEKCYKCAMIFRMFSPPLSRSVALYLEKCLLTDLQRP